jgi:2-polyprenyl-3-methyl-5-hydroxy-6-metoxy-1,4-benzoquinol methylase
MDWKAYYDARVSDFDRQDHLGQVGHTVDGAPIPKDHFYALLKQIADSLCLSRTDRLLDLCCGNGVFTRPLAERVTSTCGVDISEAMIAVARTDYAAPNLNYRVMDARAVTLLATSPEASFTRVLLYGAWQHFTRETGAEVLRALLQVTTPEAKVFLGFVPDLALKSNFFNTPERRAAHAAYVAEGTDMFGTWWDRNTLTALCADIGFSCTFTNLPPQVQANSYRFNATLVRL